MTNSTKQPRRSRRRISNSGFPQLAAELPPNFFEATYINGFIHLLTSEVIAGRLDRPTAATLGYLSQLALQTIPMLQHEAMLNAPPFKFITNVRRPSYENINPEPDSQPAPEASPALANVLR